MPKVLSVRPIRIAFAPRQASDNRPRLKWPGGKRWLVPDAVASKDGQEILVSLKWQQVGGTAEQKVPFEVISLAEAVRAGPYSKAYLVLGGAGWTLRDYFTNGGLAEHLRNIENVHILTLEHFIALSNSGRL